LTAAGSPPPVHAGVGPRSWPAPRCGSCGTRDLVTVVAVDGRASGPPPVAVLGYDGSRVTVAAPLLPTLPLPPCRSLPSADCRRAAVRTLNRGPPAPAGRARGRALPAGAAAAGVAPVRRGGAAPAARRRAERGRLVAAARARGLSRSLRVPSSLPPSLLVARASVIARAEDPSRSQRHCGIPTLIDAELL
jgi:hypothetical protein